MKNQLTPRINNLETNILLDGGMDFWPEGTSRAFINNGAGYGSSMFKFYNLNTGITITNSKDSAVPTSQLAASNTLSKTAAGTLSASTITQHDYVIEASDVLNIYKQDFSVIFWVKSSVASTRSVAIRNSTATHSFVQNYTINSANTWELKVIKYSALETCPGLIARDPGSVGVFLSFPVVNGSTAQTATLNQWISGSFTSSTGQDTTWLTGTNHNFSISGAMVLPGDWTSLQANPLAYTYLRAGKNYADEFNMISRYIEVTAAGAQLGGGFSNNTTVANFILLFKVLKRVAPTITYSNTTGFRYSNATNNYNATNITTTVSGTFSASIALTTSGIAAGNIPGSFDSTTGIIYIDARF
jgi:hypothetical protein